MMNERDLPKTPTLPDWLTRMISDVGPLEGISEGRALCYLMSRGMTTSRKRPKTSRPKGHEPVARKS